MKKYLKIIIPIVAVILVIAGIYFFEIIKEKNLIKKRESEIDTFISDAREYVKQNEGMYGEDLFDKINKSNLATDGVIYVNENNEVALSVIYGDLCYTKLYNTESVANIYTAENCISLVNVHVFIYQLDKENNDEVGNSQDKEDNMEVEDNHDKEDGDYKVSSFIPNDNVKKVIDTFSVDSELCKDQIYIDQGFDDGFVQLITFQNAKDIIKTDEACTFGDELEEEYFYECQYINYDDYNKLYNELFGKNLTKTDINLIIPTVLLYDETSDVYRIVGIAAGGSCESIDLSEIIDAKEDGEYMYIYEKVAFAWPSSQYGNYKIVYPHTSKQIEVGSYNYSEIAKKLKYAYFDTFETYKWTFKKNNNGGYTYQSLEFVK